MIREQWNEKDVEGIGRDLIWGTIEEFTWKDRGELQETSMRIAGLRAEI
jgi:hypothetical protein